MKVCVLGGTGNISTSIVKLLLEQGHVERAEAVYRAFFMEAWRPVFCSEPIAPC